MEPYAFKQEFEVRDYECDLAGMVNNAVYLHYLEHTRHAWLRSNGIDFSAWHQRGISLIVTRIELDFLWPLRSGDRFYVGLKAQKVSRLRFGFHQDIFRLPDEKSVLRARIVGSAINPQGRPHLPPELEALINAAFPPRGGIMQNPVPPAHSHPAPLQTVCGRPITNLPEYYYPTLYQGCTIYFCTEFCLAAFQADPDRFYQAHSRRAHQLQRESDI